MAGSRSRDFSELKGYCVQLLDLIHNNQTSTSSATAAATLSQLHQFLGRSSPDALQPFFDYTLFPLLLLLDAAITGRSPPGNASEQRSRLSYAMEMPQKVSDAVAERVLQCLEELLKKCHVGSVDQMVVLLKKLTHGALLSPLQATEEFRGGVVSCFKELLLSLSSCSNEFCSCKQITGWPALLDRKDLQSRLITVAEYESESGECLLAFLRSQSASAAVGHWLSLLLKSADAEVARGHRGSGKLRAEAFMALRILVAKVGCADALAFFLPGVVSQFGKVLHVSKTMISGAAGSTEAMDQAIRGLAEFLMIVLEDDANISILDLSTEDISGLHSNMEKSPLAFLEELRYFPGKKQDNQGETIAENLIEKVLDRSVYPKGNGGAQSDVARSLCVDRTKDWLARTSAPVDKLLSATFPQLCVHPSTRVRHGVLAAIQGLLSKCSCTLKESRLMLVECLCALVCDDSEEVSAAAQVFLRPLSSGKHHIKHDLTNIFNRLFEKLPEVVIGREESLALSHAQKLLVLIYFSGPQLIKDHLLQSPMTAARFFDRFAMCLSQHSVFAGSLDKLLMERRSSVGYLRSIAEMKNTGLFVNDNKVSTGPSEDSNLARLQTQKMLSPLGKAQNEYDLPRMPPWFSSFGSQKLYQALAGILRFVGLSLVADSQNEGCLSIIKDIPLGYLRRLVAEIRMKEYTKESWQSWYSRTGSGHLVRQASTAACILNEMIFGLSDQAVDNFEKLFHKSSSSIGNTEDCNPGNGVTVKSGWKVSFEKDVRIQLIDCIGSVLHEYLSPEIWNLPLEPNTSLQDSNIQAGDISLHFFHDNTMLYQVIIDGIGIFDMCLKGDFISNGFLSSSLYVLLENLICSNFQIRHAADAVLHVISATSGYQTVGHLVLANSDYVIDSICRQLRHMDLNPHVPSVLAATLSYIGVAHKILPLLEEPMHAVSQELEILGRHQHPHLTIPFLKAVAEIAKASKLEACSLPYQAESFYMHSKSKVSYLEKEKRKASQTSVACFNDGVHAYPAEPEINMNTCSSDDTGIEQCESILFDLNESKRYRQTIGSIVGSCITAAAPLLASVNQAACLVALGIIEDSIMALAKVEEAYKLEKETKNIVEQVVDLCEFHNLRDKLDADDDGTQENRLLPAMNRIWPFLVVCVQNRNPAAVRRCAGVISSTVLICGGDFFSRRFYTDGPYFWKLLSTSPFQKKPVTSKGEKPLQLPYRNAYVLSDNSRAEISDLKVQVAVLNMIADLSRNKRSASALEAVLKRVSGLVVGIACSGVVGLRDASMNALRGLASMDPDLIWLLLADVYYSLNKKSDNIPPPPSAELPDISQVLPPPSSPKCYLYVQYGGQSYGFNIDYSSVEFVFKNLNIDDSNTACPLTEKAVNI